MPRLLERYTADSVRQEIGGRRAEAGDFGGEAAQALQGLGATALRSSSRVAEQIEEDDTRRVLVGQAQLRAEFAKRTDDALLNGEALDKIEEDFSAKLADIRNNATTRKGLMFADQHGAVTAQSFQEQARQISARRHGTALVKDVETVISSASQAMQKSPELLPFFQDGLDTLFKQFEGKKLPPDVLAKARENAEDRLLYAAGHAALERDPHSTLQRLQEGDWEGMKSEHRVALINKAQVDIRALKAQSQEDAAAAARQQRANDDAALGRVVSDHISGKRIDLRAFDKTEGISGAMKEHVVNLVERWNKTPKEKADHAVANEIYSRIFLPEGNPQRIDTQEQLNQALIDGTITPQEHGPLSARLAARERPYEKAAAKLISEGIRTIQAKDALGLIPPGAADQAARWRRDVTETLETARAAGEKVSDYLNGGPKDIRNLLPAYVTNARQSTAARAEAARQAEVAAAAAGLTEGVAAPSATPAAAAAPKAAPSAGLPVSIPGVTVSHRGPDGRWVYRINNKEDFAKLPSGSIGRSADGEERVRP